MGKIKFKILINTTFFYVVFYVNGVLCVCVYVSGWSRMNNLLVPEVKSCNINIKGVFENYVVEIWQIQFIYYVFHFYSLKEIDFS